MHIGKKSFVKGLKSLISLLTAIPIGSESVDYAAQYFYLVPLIGLIEGAIVYLSILLLHTVGLRTITISILYLFIHLLVTGGIHIDGYADYSDVIGSHRTGEYAIKILKDSRRGTFAIVSIALNLFISSSSIYILLQKIPIHLHLLRLIPIYIISVEVMYVTACFGIEEPYDGLGRRFVVAAKIPDSIFKNILIFSIVYLLPSFLINIGILELAVEILTMLLIAIIIAFDSRKRLGFVNGDVLGFSYELTRLTCMVIITCI